jgi:hypothetical protein
MPLPNGVPNGRGWNLEFREVRRNKVFCVLIRPLPNGEIHLMVSSLSGDRPTFHEMQRIKNEIAGECVTAVEVYPPADKLVDGANAYHLWTLPGPIPFGLKP